MLSSLFGDLRSLRGVRSDGPGDDGGFAATALMESIATEVTEQGHIVDNHQKDLVVTGSPAQAIREHFAATRADLDTASRQITLLDPSGVWGAAVVKALSDATGRPVERLHLREQGTLRTLAVIERTTLVRRHEDTLRIYHADVRAPGADNAAIPVALMEGSHMTAVVVGAMSPSAIDGLLATLQQAVNRPEWRCPTLLFMLPPSAVWIANKVAMQDWPQRVRVQVLNEALTSASAVWNALLGLWNRVKTVPPLQPLPPAPEPGLEGFQFKVSDLSRPAQAAAPGPGAAGAPGEVGSAPAGAARGPDAQAQAAIAPQAPLADPLADAGVVAPRPRRVPLAPQAADAAVEALMTVEGVLGCAVVDADTGFSLARRTRDGHAPMHLELAAAGSAQVLRAHQQTAGTLGLVDPIEEVMTSAGSRHHLLRTVARHPGLFLFALLDKQRSNLALARYKLMEAEQAL